MPERIQIELRINATVSGVSGTSARIPQCKIVTAIIPAITNPPDKATARHLNNAYFFTPDLLTTDLIYPELKSSQKLSANGTAQKIAANGEKELRAKGMLRYCDMLPDSEGSNIVTNNGLLISNTPTMKDTYNRGLENILFISLLNI